MWEYRTVELLTLEPLAIERILNDLGRQNWELVSYAFADSGSTGFAVLKRKGRDVERRSANPGRRRTDRE